MADAPLPGARRRLLWIGALSAVVYGLVSWLYPDRGERGLRHAVSWSMVLALGGLHLAGAREVRRWGAGGAGLLVGAFLVFAVAAAPVRPFHSTDVYAYVNVGWMEVRYGRNPYLTTPQEVPGMREDPMVTWIWADRPCTYGFAFAHLSRLVVRLGGGDLERTVLWFKALGALSLLLVALAVARLFPRFGNPEERLFLLLWSPFFVLQFVSNAHNDLLQTLCVVLAMAAAERGRGWAVLPLLALGALVKVTALAVAPFALVFVVRRHGWRTATVGVALSVLVGLVVSWPYVLDLARIRWREAAGPFETPWLSLQAAVGYAYESLAHAVPWLEGTAGGVRLALFLAATLAFLGFAAVRFFRAWRSARYEAEDLLLDAVLVLFVGIVFASSTFVPWYLAMFAPLAFAMPEGHALRRASFWLTMSWLFVFTALGRARVADALLMTALPLVLLHRRGGLRLAEPLPVPAASGAPLHSVP
jgi:hypothetical protein